jgi:uncharacterized protein
MDFLALDALAAKLMRGRKSHKEREIGAAYDHGKRVSEGVISLRKAVSDDDSHDDLLRAAAMFHDVGKGIEPHAHSGSVLVRDLLQGYATADEVEEMARLIAAHCDRHPNEEKHDLWAKLLQDADLLDHFGTYDIWMCFSYYAYNGQEGIQKAADFMENELPQHAAKHRELLNFEVSRRIFDEKMAFERCFTQRLLIEATGNYIPIP